MKHALVEDFISFKGLIALESSDIRLLRLVNGSSKIRSLATESRIITANVFAKLYFIMKNAGLLNVF